MCEKYTLRASFENQMAKITYTFTLHYFLQSLKLIFLLEILTNICKYHQGSLVCQMSFHECLFLFSVSLGDYWGLFITSSRPGMGDFLSLPIGPVVSICVYIHVCDFPFLHPRTLNGDIKLVVYNHLQEAVHKHLFSRGSFDFF